MPTSGGVTVRGAWGLLGLLVAFDLLLILLHLGHAAIWQRGNWSHWLADTRWQIDNEAGVAEAAQTLKLLGVVALLGALYAQRRSRSAAAWGAVFTFVLLDDTLELHETWGAALADALHLQNIWGVRAQDLGEVAVWAAAGLFLGSFVLAAYQGAGPQERAWSRHLAALLALLVLFGGLLDVLHGRWTDERLSELFALYGPALALFGLSLLEGRALLGTALPALLTAASSVEVARGLLEAVSELLRGHLVWILAEDGGEMLAVSGVLAYLAGLLRRV
jgi:hypothetical protein